METQESKRPRPLVIGVVMLGLPLAVSLLTLFTQGTFHASWLLLIALVISPVSFALYRLYLGDGIALAVVAIASIAAIGFGCYAGYQAYTFEVPQHMQDLASEGAGGVSGVVVVEMAERSKASAAYAFAVVIWLVVGLTLVCLPTSIRWIRRKRNASRVDDPTA